MVPRIFVGLVSLLLVVAFGIGERAGADASTAVSVPRKPKVSKVLPASGPSTKPPRVIIKGKRLRSVVKVKFGGRPAVRIRVISGRRISVKPPAHRPGKVRVRVKTRRGGWSNPKRLFTYVAPTPDPSGVTTRISDDQDLVLPSISADGGFVSFVRYSEADGQDELYVWDRDTGERTKLVDAQGPIKHTQISADGTFVSFVMPDLGEPAPQYDDVWLVEVATKVVTRVTNGNQFTFRSWVSADGGFVSFFSSASDLVAGDTNNKQDVFVWERATDTIQRVSDGAGDSFLHSSVSDDGRFIAYDSGAAGRRDVFVADLLTDITEQIVDGNSSSLEAVMSANGRFVAFSSQASDLVPGDTTGHTDIFVWDRVTSVARRATAFGAASRSPSISGDGRYVGYVTLGDRSPPGDPSEQIPYDIYRWDRLTGRSEQVTAGDGPSYGPEISDHGRHVLFQSEATNLVSDDPDNFPDYFLWTAIAP